MTVNIVQPAARKQNSIGLLHTLCFWRRYIFLHILKRVSFIRYGVFLPGTASLNFLNGKRKQYQTSVSYFFICTGIYLIVHNFIINQFHYHVSDASFALMNMKDQANVLLRTHFAPIFIPILLLSSVIIYLILAKPKFYFTEVFILSLYGGGTYLMMLFLNDVILGFILQVNIITPPVFLWQTIISSLYNFWFCFDFFKKVQLPYLWLKLFTTAIVISITGLAVMNYVPMAWIYLFNQH